MSEQGDCRRRLGADDERVLDGLVDAGFDPALLERLGPEDAARGERIVDLLGLLRDYPVEDGDESLVHATLAGIDRHEAEAASRRSLGAKADRRGSGLRALRVPDLVSVAAILLIAASIVIPVSAQLRHRAIDQRCSDNLRQMGYAFARYASDYDGAMPLARAGLHESWDTLANVVNLEPLLRGDYCESGHLHCPGVHDESHDSSYSYQWQRPGASATWGAGPARVLVLGDRNPLIDAYRRGEIMRATSISPNHGGRGQNVLSNDGSSLWLEQPIIGARDNIWLPAGADALERGAQPADGLDVFLVH
jgi:hypothetical protein